MLLVIVSAVLTFPLLDPIESSDSVLVGGMPLEKGNDRAGSADHDDAEMDSIMKDNSCCIGGDARAALGVLKEHAQALR